MIALNIAQSRKVKYNSSPGSIPWFCFPLFQLPGVNHSPEADDPPPDTWSEGQ